MGTGANRSCDTIIVLTYTVLHSRFSYHLPALPTLAFRTTPGSPSREPESFRMAQAALCRTEHWLRGVLRLQSLNLTNEVVHEETLLSLLACYRAQGKIHLYGELRSHPLKHARRIAAELDRKRAARVSLSISEETQCATTFPRILVNGNDSLDSSPRNSRLLGTNVSTWDLGTSAERCVFYFSSLSSKCKH